MENQDDNTSRILNFLDSIGISHRFCTITGDTFLPGIDIEKGVLLVDREKLLYPGDLLHEAGHIAVLEKEKREVICGNAGITDGNVDGEEIGAILWSYAALKKIGLSEEVVFHPNGYKGASQWHIENFRSGFYPGLPLLEWMGLCISPERAHTENKTAFPEMIRWLR